MKEEKEINLVNLVKNQRATILAITAGAKTAKRLADLGVIPNTQIKILRKAAPQGPIEIEIRGSSLVLGKGIVSKILVKQT